MTRDLKFRYTFGPGGSYDRSEWFQKVFTLEEIEKANIDLLCFTAKDGSFCEIKARDQFTGLKDRNDAEVFEGDIFRSDDYPYRSDGFDNYYGVVEWLEDDCSWYCEKLCVSDRVRGLAIGGRAWAVDWNKAEVLGNIALNPKLMEVE